MRRDWTTARNLMAAAALMSATCAWAVQRLSKDAVVIAVSPGGSDAAAGTVEHPFKTVERAQQAVRLVNSEHDVVVQLGDGVYRLRKPLCFAAMDGGRNGHLVVWRAAEGARPVLSGAMAVTGWKLFDREKQIYVVDTPAGVDTRQLW